MPDLVSLEGKIAVVTGATRGIGFAIADLFARQGASLVLNAREESEVLQNAVEDLRSKYNSEVAAIAGDVAHSSTADKLARRAFAMGKRLDIYVNNAGLLQDGLIGMVPDKDIDQVLSVNLASVLHGTQAAARVMRRGGGGAIVNLASIIGRFGNKGQLVYGASKAGVIGATYSAAKELAPLNIRVNAIAPGFIKTDMTAQLPPEKFEERAKSIAMGRVGNVEDVARTALFLASDLSSYVTGQVIGVDGGMLI